MGSRLLFLVTWAALFGCTLEDADRCGEGYIYENGNCVLEGNIDIDPELWIGSACSCAPDAECNQAGVPQPTAGTISGCDHVPTDMPGAVLACLRSYEGDLGPDSYYANGYCSLMSTSCEGNDTVCSQAVSGDYDAMTSCPVGSVLLSFDHDIEVMGFTATVHNKICVLACTGNECRDDETDPVLNGDPTQYQCLDHDGVTFCQDPRNLTGEYTAEAF